MSNKRPASAGHINQHASRGPVKPRKARGKAKRDAIREQKEGP